jgi:MFS family permease
MTEETADGAAHLGRRRRIVLRLHTAIAQPIDSDWLFRSNPRPSEDSIRRQALQTRNRRRRVKGSQLSKLASSAAALVSATAIDVRQVPPVVADASEATYPAPAIAWYVVGVLTVAYMFSFIDRQILALLVQPIERDFGLTDTQVGALQGITFAVLYTALGMPIGWLADRFSRRAIIAAGVALWSLMATCCGLARTVPQLALARMGVGVGEAALSPSAYSLLVDYFPPRKLGRAFGTYTLGISVGSGAAFIVGGYLVNHFGGVGQVFHLPLLGDVRGWQMIFILTGAPGLLVSLLMFTFRNPPRRGLLKLGGESAARLRIPTIEVAKFIWRRRRFFGPHFVAFGLLAMIAYGIGAWGAEGFRRNPSLHMTAGDAAMILGAGGLLFSCAGALLVGSLSDWLTAKGYADAPLRVCIGIAVWTSITGVAAQFMPSVWLLFIVFAVLNLSLGSYAVLGPMTTNMVTPNQMRGQASALYLLVLNLIGLGIGPTIIPAISDHLFHDPSMVRHSIALVCGVCGVTAASILFALRPVYMRLVEDAVQWRGSMELDPDPENS